MTREEPQGPKKRPRLAVLIPAYNAETTIGKALASLAANAEPHDVIIVDDGSRIPLADSLLPKDNQTILRAEKNLGITGALNLGVNYILNEGYAFLARLDADDAASPDRLVLQRRYLDEHPDVALVGGWGRIVDETGSTLFHLHFPEDHDGIVKRSYYNSSFLHPALMMRTSALRELGGYSDRYPSAEDYELTRRIAGHMRVANLPQYLVDYTMSDKGISLSKRRQLMISRLRVQWAYRRFSSPHFYFGVLKTLALWFLPVTLITSIKRRKKVYRKRGEKPAHG